MDEVDIAFVNSLMPENAISTGFLAVVTWLDLDGEPHWRVYNQTDGRISSVLGLLEIAKLNLAAQCGLTTVDED